MDTKKILEDILKLTRAEQRNLTYEQLLEIMMQLNDEEIVELSNIIGYPVFTRLCMGALKHKFVLLQDGAAVIVVNKDGQILMQQRKDNDKWGLPGGCQELGEEFEDTAIRELQEETNLVARKEDIKLLGVLSGIKRKRCYPNGDVVFNNTVLYLIDKYEGKLAWNYESKEMQFFDLDNMPPQDKQHDADLIECYKEYIKNKSEQNFER